jgi:hypothetical protein
MTAASRTGHQRQVLQAMKAVRVLGPGSFSWLDGEPFQVGAAPPGRRPLIDALSRQLYQCFFVTGRPVDQPVGKPETGSMDGRSALGHDFRRLRAELPPREITGEVLAVLPAGYVVLREGIRMLVPFGPAAPSPAPGGRRIAHFGTRSWTTSASPGHFSAQYGSVPASLRLLRVYWHVRPELAEELVAQLQKGLTARGISFRVKVIRDPGHYLRRDSAVLYVARETWPDAAPVIFATHAMLKPGMEGGVPALTKTAAKGLALAEDPAVARTSFGMHRCTALARAIVAGSEQGADTDAALLQACATAFRAASIDPDRPYLRRGSPELAPAGPGGP